ncbi:MAG: chemotaxis protein CheD [Planctomycetota bacterium]|jgi:chemotaxis protein CheD
MKKIIDVNTGEVRIGSEKVLLRSLAIGSCIVIAAYDSEHKVGAMAHVMLPGSSPKKNAERTKYAADAIDALIAKMIRAGAARVDIEVCLVGGGNVLKKKKDTICRDNIDSTTELLKQKGIPIRASAVGGTKRKGVFLDVGTGTISFTLGDGKEKPLWEPTRKRRLKK